MRFGPLILALLACAVVAGLLHLWSTRAGETPAALLHDASQRLEDLEPDFERGLRELSRAIDELSGRLEDDDPEVRADARRLGAELLHERARTHRRLSNWGLAVRDARRAVEEFGGAPGELLELACECAIKDRDHATALELSERLIREAPERAKGLAFRGETRLATVREEVDELVDLLHEDLPELEVRVAVPQIRRAIALGPDSPLFEAGLETVALAYDRPSSRRLAVERVRGCAARMRSARRDFVDSLGIEPTRLATEGIQEILFHAGQQKDAALFGRLLLDLPQVALPSPTLLRTVEAWIALDQPARASSILNSVAQVQPQIVDFRLMDTDLYERWGVALYRLGEWRRLQELSGMFWQRAWSLKTREERERFHALAQMFSMLSGTALNQTWMLDAGYEYLKYEGSEPFPGARLAVYLAIAKVGRLTEDRTVENYAVGAATDFAGVNAPPELREDLGGAWRERASSFRALEQAVAEEDALAKAMSVWPPLRAELEDAWITAGRASILERRRAYRMKTDEYLQNQVYLPETPLGSWELLEVAGEFLEAGDLFGAKSFVELVFERYPGFPPALEVRARIAYRAEDYDLAADSALTLLETGGGTFGELRALVDLPVERLSGEMGIRWFRAVPPTRALLAMLDRLPTERKRELLLSSLLHQHAVTPLEGPTLGRAAFLCAELERWPECLDLLAPLDADSPEFPELAGLSLLAVLNATSPTNRAYGVERLTGQIERAPALEARTMLPAIDQLHAAGFARQASRVLDRLLESLGNADPARGEVVIRDAIHALLDDEIDLARERLLEAGLFVDPVQVEVGRMAIASDKRRWDELSDAARDVEALQRFETPYERALLLGMRGGRTQVRRALEYLDLEPARDGTPNPLVPLARMALRAIAGEDPSTWETDPIGLVRGEPFVSEPGGPQDPRQVLAALFALRVEAWPIWTLDRLSRFPDAHRLSAWGVTQVAAALAALGEVERANGLLGTVVGPGTVNFAPAWYLREQLVLRLALGDRTDSDYLDTRGFRVHAVGAEGIDDFERDLVAVYTAEWQGRHELAVELLEALLERRPGEPDLEYRLADNLFHAGREQASIQAFRPVIARGDDYATRALPTVLEALRIATDVEGTLHPRARWTFLESLETRFPDDPAVVRERARLQIEGERNDDEYGIARAWELLDVFRDRTRQASIDELRAGEAEQWLELFLRYDPVRARAFARAELHANPASPDARWMWAKVLSESGEIHAAIDELASSTAAVSHPPSLRLYARLLAVLGGNEQRVDGLLQATRVAEGLRRADPELAYVRALSRRDGPARDESIAALTTLWKGRDALTGSFDPAEVGLYLAQSLLRRGENVDSVVAGGILDELVLREREPVRRDFLRAMGHLARHHAPREQRDDLAPPPSEEEVAERFASLAR